MTSSASSPPATSAAVEGIPRGARQANIPRTAAANGNEIKYPAVGPANGARPAAPAAKTGRPAAPTSRYSVIARKPRRAPSTAPHNKTANVCRVIGTPLTPIGKAADTEQTASSAAKVAINARSDTGRGGCVRIGHQLLEIGRPSS